LCYQVGLRAEKSAYQKVFAEFIPLKGLQTKTAASYAFKYGQIFYAMNRQIPY